MGSPLLVVVGLAVAPGFAMQRPDSARSLDQAFRIAQEASGARDWKTTRRALEAALRFSPESPPALYNLARAEARLGNGTAAIRALERLVGQGVARAVQADTAFGSLRDSPGFRDVARRLATSAEPIVRSDTAFVLPDPDFIPEGIAWDPLDSAFYIGSLSGRGIARAAGNRVTTWVRPESARLTQILGLRIDGPRRRLWVASLTVDTAAPRFFRGVGGWAALEAYQLPGGRRLGRWVPDSSGPHLLNDIAVAPGGDVYVTDSEGSALHRLAGGEGVLERVHHDPERFVYPNGIALSPDGTRAYVAHYEGMSMFNLSALGGRAPVRIAAVPGVPTSGIDGLYGCGDGLLAVQYRLDFQQITRFALTADGRSVSAARALERRHPAQTGATTGAPAGRAFYYIANAQLERLDEDQALRAGAGERSVVLRLPLGNACDS